MKPMLQILLVTCLVSFLLPPTLGATIQEIEKLPFNEAYRQWLKEKKALLQKRKPTFWILPWGSSDPQTGKFTPTTFFALTCRLGRDAHAYEVFLVQELRTNDYVSMILDASSRLCSHYGVGSEAPIVFDPQRGYATRPRGAFMGIDARRRVWLQAIAKSNSQPSSPANRR